MSSPTLPRDVKYGIGLGILYLLLGTPMARDWLEATMSRHMLVQMPLLVMLGIMGCRLLPCAGRTPFWCE